MATRAAWVLNLDAEYELADPRGYTPSRAMLRYVHTQAASLADPAVTGQGGLLQRGEIWLSDEDHTVPPGTVGKAWCPTPRAVARLKRAGAIAPAAPPLEVLQRVNHRRFAAELRLADVPAQYAESAQDALARLAEPSPSGRWVAKRAFGLAGRGHRRFDRALDERDRHWVHSSCKHGHGVLIEPWVGREADFAQHAIVGVDGKVQLGRPLAQHCDARGMWQRTTRLTRDELEADEQRALERCVHLAASALHTANYFGPFGLDAFRYRNESGERRFNACVEINARYSMGWGLSGLPT